MSSPTSSALQKVLEYNNVMNRLTRTLRLVIFSLFIATQLFLLSPSQTLAQGAQPWSQPRCVQNGTATIQGLECLLANILTVAITVIGFAAFVMFVVAGFKWMLSGGNTKGMESARNTMTYAVVGIVVSLTAYLILNVLSDFTGITQFLQFRVPG